MGSFSLMHWIIVALVVLVLFGRGRISEVMGDFGKGIKSFKQGMADENDRPVSPPPAQISQQSAEQAPAQQAPVQQAAQSGNGRSDNGSSGQN